MKEVQKFGNEYIAISQYIKNFMKNIMQKTKIVLENLDITKKDAEVKVDKLTEYMKYIILQRNELKAHLLK